MPTQSRGFFACDFCGIALDTLEEAAEHEQTQCPKRPSHHHLPPQQHHGPPPSRYPMGRPYGGMAPVIRGGEMDAPPPGYPPYPMSTPHRGPFKSRLVPLMGPHDRGESVSPDDTIACQNIEFFEASAELAAEWDGSQSGGLPVAARQVGLRCAHCGGNAKATNSGYRILFPGSLGSIASDVRSIADNHLSMCSAVPGSVREICGRAAKRRQQLQSEQEGLGRNNSEDEQSRLDLLDYCVGFCQFMGIVNKQPHKTGITFADSEGPALPPTPSTAETPAPHRGMPPSGNPYSAERGIGPPIHFDPHQRMGYPTPVSAGGPFMHMPPTRPGMPPMLAGPMGQGDAIAPTPLQRRRDRPEIGSDRVPYPRSAERSEEAPPTSPYPTPYSQGPPGSEHRGYGREMETPAQSNFEGKQGQSPPSNMDAPGESPPGYSHFELPSNFPFFQELDRTWHCKFCCHVHPSYRDPQAIWSSPSGGPPPGNFIDSHLSMCRAYHQSISSPPPIYQGGPPPPYGAPHWMPGYPPPPGWEGQSPPQGGGPPPPHVPHHPPSGHPGGPPPPDPHYPYTGMPPNEDYSRGRNLGGAPKGMAANRKENLVDGIRSSIAHLVAKENEYEMRNPVAKKDSLVLEEDKLLLTDYFYHLMKQLRLCRFSEADRKTRGGKREKIKLGYGGLQCIHCADIPNSRKFFWSNVDRLANSFAEIPGHVLKCRRCPMQTKDALANLKAFHPEQMARLPRGSQKVFFRRMWRRLHDEDEAIGAAMAEKENREGAVRSDAEEDTSSRQDASPEKNSPLTSKSGGANDESGESSSDENPMILHASSEDAAKALTKASQSSDPPRFKVLLAIPEDKEWLSDMDCFIRKQLEVFCATEDDVEIAQSDRKYPVQVGQVGIRCIHCSLASGDARIAGGTAVAYPFAISGIYEAVREFQRLHLDSCEQVPNVVKQKIGGFKGASSLSSVLRKYYVLAAKALGLHDTREGIRSGGEHVPIGSQKAFPSVEGYDSLGASHPHSAPESPINPKRRGTASPSPEGPPSKKSKSDESDLESAESKSLEPSPHKVARMEGSDLPVPDSIAAKVERGVDQAADEMRTELTKSRKEGESSPQHEDVSKLAASLGTQEKKGEEATEAAASKVAKISNPDEKRNVEHLEGD